MVGFGDGCFTAQPITPQWQPGSLIYPKPPGIYAGVVGCLAALLPLPLLAPTHGLLAWCLGALTSQVSDVVVTTRQMRRLTLAHSVTSFAFNMLLALGVNLMASAIK